ncbi:MAG: hypothetical protein QQN63_14570, partial [Nitrosopumilus sp.]
DQVERWRPKVVGYEDVAYQKSIDYWVKEEMKKRATFFVLNPIKRTGKRSKETYIMGLHPIAASGAIHIRPFMKELVTEFLSFPRGAHDDLIDCLAMQTQLWKRTKSKKESKHKIISEGFDLDFAIESLRARHRGKAKTSAIFAPRDTPSTVLHTYEGFLN